MKITCGRRQRCPLSARRARGGRGRRAAPGPELYLPAPGALSLAEQLIAPHFWALGQMGLGSPTPPRQPLTPVPAPLHGAEAKWRVTPGLRTSVKLL